MRKILLFTILLSSISALAQTGDTLLYERFETGGTSFVLNSTDQNGTSGSSGFNEWIINNIYAGGSGQLVCLGFPFNFNIPATANQPAAQTGGANSNYLHIVSDAGTASGIQNCSFQAADGICTLDESNFSAMAQDISTIGYDSVTASFLWLCAGGTNIYGEFYYSINNGVSWTVVNTPISQYKSQPNWTQQNVSVPVFAGQGTIRFGFRFLNNNSSNAADPGFGIDEFLITATTNTPPVPVVAAFSVSDSTLCVGECVDFTDTSTGNPTSWFWIFQGAATAFSTQQNPSQVCYNNPGTYEVTLIASGPNGTDTLTTVSVIVNSNPPQPTITFSADTLFATPGYTSYVWSLDGTVISSATDSFYVVLTDGAYTVAISDSNGCSSESLPLNYATGINENEIEHTLLVFPNPSNGIFEIQNADEFTRIQIINSIGKKLMEIIPSHQHKIQINLENEAKGVYFLNAHHKNGSDYNLKILTRD